MKDTSSRMQASCKPCKRFAGALHAPCSKLKALPASIGHVMEEVRTVRKVRALAAVAVVLTVLVARPTASAGENEQAMASTPQGVGRSESPSARRLSRVVEDVRFSFEIPTSWERGPVKRLSHSGTLRTGRLFVSKNTWGSQGAEAVLFWTSFPDGYRAEPCANLLRRPIGPTTGHLASAMVRTPGIELVDGPAKVAVGGQPATHVVLRVHLDLGCDPGFFYTWRPRGPRGQCWAACWLESSEGHTISVWIVDVSGTRLVIEAETSAQAGLSVEPEIWQIVKSIRFSS